MSRADEIIAQIGELLEELKALLAQEGGEEEGEPAAATAGPQGAPRQGVSALSLSRLMADAGVEEVRGG